MTHIPQARPYYTIYNYCNCHDVKTDSNLFRNRIRCASIELMQPIVLEKKIKLGRLYIFLSYPHSHSLSPCPIIIATSSIGCYPFIFAILSFSLPIELCLYSNIFFFKTLFHLISNLFLFHNQFILVVSETNEESFFSVKTRTNIRIQMAFETFHCTCATSSISLVIRKTCSTLSLKLHCYNSIVFNALQCVLCSRCHGEVIVFSLLTLHCSIFALNSTSAEMKSNNQNNYFLPFSIFLPFYSFTKRSIRK